MAAQTLQITSELVDGRLVFVAEDPELPFCLAQGDSPESAEAELRQVRKEILTYLADTGQPIPQAARKADKTAATLAGDQESRPASA